MENTEQFAFELEPGTECLKGSKNYSRTRNRDSLIKMLSSEHKSENQSQVSKPENQFFFQDYPLESLSEKTFSSIEEKPDQGSHIEVFEFVKDDLHRSNCLNNNQEEDYVEILKQKWQGIIRDIRDGYIFATLFGLNKNLGREEVKIPITFISPTQKNEIEEGTRFYFYVGEKKTNKGQIIKTYSKFLIKTMPKVSDEKIKQKFNSFLSIFRDEKSSKQE